MFYKSTNLENLFHGKQCPVLRK